MTPYGYILWKYSRRDMYRMKGLVVMLAALGSAALLSGQGLDAPETPVADAAPVISPSSSTFSYTPMSAHERWHGYLHENLLSTKFGLQLFGSAFISHVDRQPLDWGLRSHGYLHQVENRFLTSSIEGGVHSSLAAALHHDMRYWRYQGKGRGVQRAAHALERTLLTYDNAGHRVFDVSAMAGIYGSTMLSTYWHGHGDPLGRGIQAGNAGVIAQAASNLIKEFSPDIKRIFVKK